jgi:tripartite-type tricarboxylate transporter receptor subunit TctC
MKNSASRSRRRALSQALPSLAIGLCAIMASSAAPIAGAQTTGPATRLIVGYPAGGPVDGAARLIAPALARELGSAVVVENRPGANATLAGDLVAKAGADASLLWFAASPTVTISPNVMRKMSFDPMRDLRPLAPVVSYYNVLVINRDLPFKGFNDLVAYARANPGKVTFGSAGIGGSNHLAAELLAIKTNTKMTHVPYKGNAPAMTDVIGGQLTMMFDIISTALPQITSGRVRAIAVSSPTRNRSLPDVPTLIESGVADFDVGGWMAIYGPPALHDAAAQRVTEATKRVLAQAEIRSRLEELGFTLWTGDGATLSKRAVAERAMWATVTKGIEID